MLWSLTMENIKLAKAIADKKMSQRKVAEDVGMKPQRLSEMIQGRLKGWKYRRRISLYLGVAEETLFPDDGNQESGQT